MPPAGDSTTSILAAPQAVTIHNSEADQQADCLGSLDQHYEQLSRGSFCGSLSSITHEGVTLFKESLGQSVFQTGCPAANQITIAAACELSAEAYWNGRHIDADAIVAFVPGSEFALRSPTRSVCVGISIPNTSLTTFDTEHSVENWHRLLRVKDCWSDRRPFESRLSSRIARLFDAVSDSSTIGSGTFDQTLDDILEDLRSVLDALAEPGHLLRVDSYPRIAKKARSVMLEQLGEPLRIGELCSSIGCSRRALQYAFQNVFGVNPVTYFRFLRLAAARRSLIDPHRTTTVQNVAAQFGFVHLPRFAQEYMQMFGELPSQSLARGRWYPSSQYLHPRITDN